MKTITITNNAQFQNAVKNLKAFAGRTGNAGYIDYVAIAPDHMEMWNIDGSYYRANKISGTGEGCAYLNFRDFCAAVKGAKTDITISYECGDTAVVYSGVGIVKVPVLQTEWPKHIKSDKTIQAGMVILHEMAAIAKCGTNDICRPVLNGVYLDFTRDAVVASDGHVICVKRVTTARAGEHAGGIIIPAQTAAALDGKYIVTINGDWRYARFVCDEAVVMIKLTEGKYPRYHACVPLMPKGCAINFKNPKAVLAAVKNFKGTESSTIVFHKRDNEHYGIRMYEDGKIAKEAIVECEGNTREQDFAVSPKIFIRGAVDWTGTLYVQDSTRAIVLRLNCGFGMVMPKLCDNNIEDPIRDAKCEEGETINFFEANGMQEKSEPVKEEPATTSETPAEEPIKAEDPAPAKKEPTHAAGIKAQWENIKAKHPDAILLFRCGDFYETYYADAETVAKDLGIALTRSDDGTNMAGFPYHALDIYLPKLIRAGHRVAICDQLETPTKPATTKKEQPISKPAHAPVEEAPAEPAPVEEPATVPEASPSATVPEASPEGTTGKESKAIPLSDMAADRLADILEEIIKEGNANGWEKPWTNSIFVAGGMAPHNVMTGRAYGDINSLFLGFTTTKYGYKTPCFATSAKLRELGCTIKTVINADGEEELSAGVPVMEKFLTKELQHTKDGDGNTIVKTDEDGNPVAKTRSHTRVVWVWNIDQTDFPVKFPERYAELVKASSKPDEYKFKNKHDDNWKDEAFDLMLSAPQEHWVVKSIGFGGNKAYYSPCESTIQLPMRKQFCSATKFYATAAHEMIHSTKAVKPRDYGRQRWGDEGYATEELVAELGSAIICHDLGMEKTIDDEHKHYAANWASVLHGDKRRDVVRRIVRDILDATAIWFRHYHKAQAALGIEREKPATTIGKALTAYKQEDEAARPVLVRKYSDSSILVLGGSKADRIALSETLNKAYPAEKNSRKRLVNTAKIWQSPFGMSVLVRSSRVSEDDLRTIMQKQGMNTADWDTTTAIKGMDPAAVTAPAAAPEVSPEGYNFLPYSEKGVILICAADDTAIRNAVDAATTTLGICARYYDEGKIFKGSPAGYCLSKKAAAKLEKQLVA